MKRRTARAFAVQSLYYMEMNDTPVPQAVHTVMHESHDSEEAPKVYEAEDIEYVLSLVKGTTDYAEQIDRILPTYLKGWKIDRLSKVDRQILRLAAYEMLFEKDVPAKVVINEAIELSKHFGTEESGKFVNGVLGKMAKEINQLKGEIDNERKDH